MKFKSTSKQTSADIHTNETRQRNQLRQTIHRLDIAALLSLNTRPQLFNILPDRIKLEEINKYFKL